MPELPEVETVRTGLGPHLQGRKIVAAASYRDALRYPLPDLSRLVGRTVEVVGRRSKYLLFRLDSGITLVWHLGMTGQFHLLPSDAERGAHEHVAIELEEGQSLRYRDARRFGYAALIETAQLESHPWFNVLGPEPLDEAFDADHMLSCCRGRKAPIKTVIMDAANVVGVGNIYAAESLFRAGIHPGRAAGRISKVRLARLVASIKEVLEDAIRAGGSTISDFVRADGKPGYFAHAFRVYGRDGQPCSGCSRRIRRIVQAGRSSFYCPGCQH